MTPPLVSKGADLAKSYGRGGQSVSFVNTAPDTPTITAGTPGATTVALTSSAFADDDAGQTQTAAQWQVTLAADTDFEDVVFDSGADTTHLTSIGITGLTPETAYIARVRHRDDSGFSATEWSAYSATDDFTTTEASDVEPFAYDDFNSGNFTGATGLTWTAGGRCSITTLNPPPGKVYSVAVVYVPPNGSANATEMNWEWSGSERNALNEVWKQYMVRFPSTWTHGSNDPNNNKFTRMFQAPKTTGYSNFCKVGSSLRRASDGTSSIRYLEKSTANSPGEMTGNNAPTAWNSANSDMLWADAPNAASGNSWIKVQEHWKNSTTSATTDGEYHLWINDVSVWSIPSVRIYGQDGWGAGYFFGAANAGSSSTHTVQFGDVSFYSVDPGWTF